MANQGIDSRTAAAIAVAVALHEGRIAAGEAERPAAGEGDRSNEWSRAAMARDGLDPVPLLRRS
ncbi:MAG: hypothetical protein QME96_06150 [Myxococcota bacterium]|nr:hypothetical protein [Myxococcota bacterium]